MSKPLLQELKSVLDSAHFGRAPFKVTIKEKKDGKEKQEEVTLWVDCGKSFEWDTKSAAIHPDSPPEVLLTAFADIVASFIFEKEDSKQPLYTKEQAEVLAYHAPLLTNAILISASKARAAKKKNLAPLQNFGAS